MVKLEKKKKEKLAYTPKWLSIIISMTVWVCKTVSHPKWPKSKVGFRWWRGATHLKTNLYSIIIVIKKLNVWRAGPALHLILSALAHGISTQSCRTVLKGLMSDWGHITHYKLRGSGLGYFRCGTWTKPHGADLSTPPPYPCRSPFSWLVGVLTWYCLKGLPKPIGVSQNECK